MGIPLLRGRDFTGADNSATRPVTIVSQATARTFWGDDDPIGRTLHRRADTKVFTVVGVVGDVRNTALNRAFAVALLSERGARRRPDGCGRARGRRSARRAARGAAEGARTRSAAAALERPHDGRMGDQQRRTAAAER